MDNIRFVRLTDYQTGKPRRIRLDQIASWYFDRGHYFVVPLYDDVDFPVKESDEEIQAAVAAAISSGDAGPAAARTVSTDHRTRRTRTSRAPGVNHEDKRNQ